jgi:hypothetical protein
VAALASALFGIAVGFIDMVHSPTRGAVLAIAFAVVAVAVLVAAVPQLRSALWFRRAQRQLAPLDVDAELAQTQAGGRQSTSEPARQVRHSAEA